MSGIKRCPQSVSEVGADQMQTGQAVITTQPVVIRGANHCRRGIKITQLGTTEVWISYNSSSNTPDNSDLLPGVRGAYIVIPTIAEIWGVTATGASRVSFLEVFD